MTRHVTTVLLLLLAAGFPSRASAVVRADGLLWRPRLATPAIVALDTPAHREFAAEVRGPASARNWGVQVANDLRAWPCQVLSATYSSINRGTEPGWQVKARVPADAPPELFALTVSSSEGTSVQGQSVSVTPTFSTDFYILHLSDEQIDNDKHTDPSGQYLRGSGSAEELGWLQEPINLIHPRLCLVTGDQIDFNGALDGWNNWMNWGYHPPMHKHFSRQETFDIEKRLTGMYLDCHRGCRVPYVEAPGNHDVTPADKKLVGTNILWHPISAAYYESQFGQRSWSFRMGDFYVLLHDWTDRDLKRWAAADYAASLADPTVTYRLVGQHFPADQAFVPATCDLMLVGHGHKTATLKTDPYYTYEDGPTFFYGRVGFFNFRRTADGWTCDQTASPRDVKKDVFTLFTDNGVVKKVRADQPDSMNVKASSVTVTNDLPEEFYDGRVRFVTDKGTYRSVRNGTILAQYNCLNDTRTAVLVKVDIPANGSVTVTLDPPSR